MKASKSFTSRIKKIVFIGPSLVGELFKALHRPRHYGTLVAILGLLWGSTLVSAFSNDDFGPTPGLSKDQVADGWLSLFDGETLYGWKAVTQANWRVIDGTIEVSEGERGLLRTTSQFDNFEMTLEFKADAHTNSGIFLRTSPSPKNPSNDCYELNIAHIDDNPFPTGSLVGRSKSTMEHTHDRWHHFRILADGPKIKVWLDDERTVEYIDPNPLGKGFIGLQLNSGKVAFRNICIKPLNENRLFDGTNLNHWNTSQKLASEFKITDKNELQISGGKGQLESVDTFGDFLFSMKCKTNAEGLNSGVFFRCIPGDVMNGYESQIQNQFKNEDRTEPVDCGTGGIFRRTQSRRVNANDLEWFSKTIITNGAHISVWVNGYQVTDWTDTRPKNANPRKGLRLEKGTIIFQGHDPTTDILLKDIRVREISKRR